MLAVIVGGSGLYAWVFASQLTTPGFGWLQRGLRRSFLRPLLSCPWCTGFWWAAVFVVTIHALSGTLDWLITPLVVLLTAAAIGFVGSFTDGIVDEDEDEPADGD